MTRWIANIACPDAPGIVHAATGAVLAAGGNIAESRQFGSVDTGQFYLRLEFDAPADRAGVEAAFADARARFALDLRLAEAHAPVRTLVLVSTAAHCLNDLLFRQRSGHVAIDVAQVVGNHPDLGGLAAFYGVPFRHAPTPAEPAARRAALAALEAELSTQIERDDIELIVLARYMQILSPEFCARYRGRIVNIHHSFLPSFKGARPYHQAHARGVKVIGATAHFVTSDLDEGPIIEQDTARVTHEASTADFVRVGQDVEAQVLSRAVRWYAERRVILDGARTVVFA